MITMYKTHHIPKKIYLLMGGGVKLKSSCLFGGAPLELTPWTGHRSNAMGRILDEQSTD